MKIDEISFKKRILLESCTIEFESNTFNHILGKNGVGKTIFAKKIYSSLIEESEVTLIGSYTNVINDVFVYELFNKSINKNNKKLIKLLNLDNINKRLLFKKLSDGQKQKMKLFLYFNESSKYFIFDEITNALDQETVNDIYKFFNEYFLEKKDYTLINITHNLQDIEKMQGNIYLFEDKKIQLHKDKKEAISKYMGVEL